MDNDELLTVEMLAKKLDCAKRSVHAWTREGKIPAPVRLAGKLLRWRAADISAWIAAGCPVCNEPRPVEPAMAERMAAMRAARNLNAYAGVSDADKKAEQRRKANERNRRYLTKKKAAQAETIPVATGEPTPNQELFKTAGGQDAPEFMSLENAEAMDAVKGAVRTDWSNEKGNYDESEGIDQ